MLFFGEYLDAYVRNGLFDCLNVGNNLSGYDVVFSMNISSF